MAIATDWRSAPLTAPDRAMLAYAEKQTLAPATLTAADVDTLRRHGFSDRDILSINLAAAYRNYITRVADGLGVELAGGADYAPELIRAFGVDPEQARVTLYADRVPSEEGASVRPDAAAFPRGPATAPPDAVAWIATTPPAEQAERFDALRAEAEALTAPLPIAHLARAFALRPEALAASLTYAKLVGLGGSGLETALEHTIGTVVAAALGTAYLGVRHAQRLLAAGMERQQVLALLRDPAGAALSGREGAVARYAARLTREPGAMGPADVEALRAAGFDDAAIITIAAATAFENFANRVAAGLGVGLEAAPFEPAILAAFAVAAPAQRV